MRAPSSSVRLALTERTTSPCFGELDSVGEQVDQDLTQAGHITIHSGRHLLVQQVGQVQALLGGSGCEQIKSRLQAITQVKGLMLQVQFASFDFGEVQNVIDDGQQRVAARADGLGVLTLLGGEARCRAASRSCQ